MGLREITTQWDTASGRNGTTVMYFDEEGATVAVQRSSLAVFWGAMADWLSNTTNWSVAPEGRVLNPNTGGLEGAWSDSTVHGDNGNSVGTPVPDSSQVLLRWATDQVYQGRFVRGRTFIPGLSQTYSVGGNVDGAASAGILAAVGSLLDVPIGFSIWSRPTAGAGGAAFPAQSASVWSEFAVLRRRRG